MFELSRRFVRNMFSKRLLLFLRVLLVFVVIIEGYLIFCSFRYCDLKIKFSRGCFYVCCFFFLGDRVWD